MNAIDEKAARWVARRDGDAWGAADQALLERWLDEDRRHRGAFLRARATWLTLDRASALGAGQPVSASSTTFMPARRQILGFGGAMAAAVVGAVVLTAPSSVRYGAALGEVRTVPLTDGSRVVLNTASTVDVTLDDRERHMRLAEGEAWFDVAKDATRPFIVASGGAEVRAIGTAFSVRRRGAGSEILVTEGVVAVKARRLLGGESVRVTAGERIFVDNVDGVGRPVKAVAEIDRALAWRSGEIVLNGETLAEAVGEFNRYNARKIVIDGPPLDADRLVGWFRTNDPESFARTAARMLNLSMTSNTDTIRLSAGDGAKKLKT